MRAVHLIWVTAEGVSYPCSSLGVTVGRQIGLGWPLVFDHGGDVHE
jgi:hypothetical protein